MKQVVKNMTEEKELFMAMELSNKKWMLGFSDGEKCREVNIPAGNQKALQQQVERARQKFSLSPNCKIYSCYEAGRDGFWIHHLLTKLGYDNVVVDPASIEVNRRHRHLKTDRLDVEKLLRMLMRYHLHGERQVWRVVVVPKPEEEDERRATREIERFKKERAAHVNRIKSLLVQHGIHIKNIRRMAVEELRDWSGALLLSGIRAEIERERERLKLADQQLRLLTKELEEKITAGDTLAAEKAQKLLKLYGIGIGSAPLLAQEFFGWRKFQNRRQVGAAAGLTGTAYSSGDLQREQGISKAGNRRVRRIMIELGWKWLYYQPRSELSRWFIKRFAHGGKRMHRIGIVAVARKLLIALWRYVEFDELPAGAVLTK